MTSLEVQPVASSKRERAPHEQGVQLVTDGRLRWKEYPGVYKHRARYPNRCAAVYAVARYEGRNGPRWLCWFFPDGVHVFDSDGYRIAGGPPMGLFAMRTSVLAALKDAEHHLKTGEARP